MQIAFSLAYPIAVIIAFKYFDLSLDDAVYLKLFPVGMAVYVTSMLGISHFKGNKLIMKFVKRFRKKELSVDEVNYIKGSTLYWTGVSFINIIVHVIVLLYANEYIWAGYASFGWYSVFVVGAIFQIVHKKFFYKKRVVEDV